MRYLLIILFLLVNIAAYICCNAWDGFDADTSDLVEIVSDVVPPPGSTIDVINHDTDSTQTCLVESVKRNRRTIEVVVREPSGNRKTLVMEGR